MTGVDLEYMFNVCKMITKENQRVENKRDRVEGWGWGWGMR